MNILLINGPNLNLLGHREVEKYGKESLKEIERRLSEILGSKGRLTAFQSNAEAEIISFIQEEGIKADAIIINAASLTHTSVGIRDALIFAAKPFIEVHITNLAKREAFRRQSFLSDIAEGVVAGLGTYGYDAALHYFLATKIK